MSTIPGVPSIAKFYHKRFKFIVQVAGITGLESAGFMTFSGLRGQIAVVQTHEGGALIPDKSPGRLTFPDVTLTRGVTSDDSLYNWWAQAAILSSQGTGPGEALIKKQVVVIQLDRSFPGSPLRVGAAGWLRSWVLVNAWPIDFSPGEWDADSDESTVEEVVLAYDFFFQLENKPTPTT